MSEKIRDIVLDDPKVKLHELAAAVGILSGRVFNILHKHLSMKKLTARWVSRLLTIDLKRERVRISQHCLNTFRRKSKEFLRRYITVDETWIDHYTPGGGIETTVGTMNSKGWESSEATKDATIGWKGKAITGQYYASLLDRLNDEIKKKRPHLAKKKILVYQDNASAHKSVKAMAKLNELRYELLPHPPYSSDLAPFDFYLFPNLKNGSRERDLLQMKRLNGKQMHILAV
ncbi:PREDICTED: histone-lysine N-methyltransferase SETMAR-like [Dinoponera quadriceps]|uniref:Histone-lysine N-methyltransferase SETMAR-like n=1 Tax=Dinoponera quadriceps TaxID=609295 RepID=A0A6P3Y2E7_DINQU|nr:PREDICTED: histone-lysine N-methyltransferase SETMAR-like [Dinoponera quadriceps]